MKSFAEFIIARVVVGFLGLMAAASVVRAEIVTAWVEGLNSRARLVAGTIEAGNLAGLEIDLTKGWKTYWRNPGDGGIAPEFDWNGSENVRDVSVLYPFPKRYTDAYGTAIGYKGNVIFPVMFEPIDPMKPQILRLQVDYAVCEALCIPAQANIELQLPGGLSLGPSPRLHDVIAQVPLGRGDNDARIVNVVAGREKILEFEASFSGKPEDAEIFAEGPAMWFLPAPTEIRREFSDGHTLIKYRLDLSHLPKSAKIRGETLLFTIKGGARPVEQTWRFD
ncbi:MAG: hypothetical protein K8F25_11370 [Fimbriimonadaceae bacterium]|nr:hypothetical protein [Alphaproteobacteria bacterium]